MGYESAIFVITVIMYAIMYYSIGQLPHERIVELDYNVQPKESAANMICGDKRPPKVAVCVMGKARTFSHPLAYQTMRTNLIDSFGGDPYILMDIQTKDFRGDLRPQYNGGIDQSVDQVLHAAEAIADDTLLNIGVQNDVLVYTTKNYRVNLRIDRRTESQIFRSNLKQWTTWNSTGTCTRDYMMMRHQRIRVTRLDNIWQGLQSSMHSEVNQQSMWRRCYNFVSEHESRMNVTFDYVIYTRPDLMYPIAARAYCLHAPDPYWVFKQSDHVHIMTRRALDVFYDYTNHVAACPDVPPGMAMEEFQEYYAKRHGIKKFEITRVTDRVAILLRPDQPGFPTNVCLMRQMSKSCTKLFYQNRYNQPEDPFKDHFTTSGEMQSRLQPPRYEFPGHWFTHTYTHVANVQGVRRVFRRVVYNETFVNQDKKQIHIISFVNGSTFTY